MKVTEKSEVAISHLAMGIDAQVIHHDVAMKKVAEQQILTKSSKCNSFQVTTDLLNSENLKIAIASLYNELYV